MDRRLSQLVSARLALYCTLKLLRNIPCKLKSGYPAKLSNDNLGLTTTVNAASVLTTLPAEFATTTE